MLFRLENGYRLSRLYGSVKLTFRFMGEVLFENNFYIGAHIGAHWSGSDPYRNK